MYVNELTRDYGEEGRQAIRELLTRSRPDVRIEWVT
jgi:predicted solute-binding protein